MAKTGNAVGSNTWPMNRCAAITCRTNAAPYLQRKWITSLTSSMRHTCALSTPTCNRFASRATQPRRASNKTRRCGSDDRAVYLRQSGYATTSRKTH